MKMIDMTRMRTLIQLEVPINDLNCDEYSTDLVATSEELRETAIKWIKLLEKDIKKDIKRIGDYEEVTGFDKGGIYILKHFFNITQKDIENDD